MESIFERINELSFKYRDFTASCLSELVKIKSLSGREKEVQVTLRRLMLNAGFDEVRIDGMGNVIGRIGKGKKILAIDGHVDTVDSGSRQNWSFEPFCGEIRDGFVLGRGAADQKGGVASLVTAGRILRELGFDKDVTVYFTGTVFEEDCEGLCWKYIIEEEGIKPDTVIITEPTGLNLYLGHRGRMEMQVHLHGRSSHGSAPGLGMNAAYMASRTALEVEKLNGRLAEDAFLGKGSITVTDIISRGPSLCAVPDYSRLHLDRRLTSEETREKAVEEIEELLQGMEAEVDIPVSNVRTYTGLELSNEQYYPAWKTDESDAVVRRAVKVHRVLTGSHLSTGRWLFSTNGVMTSGMYGIATIGFGPGEESMAHAPDEKIRISDLVTASAFYAAYAYEMAND
ncbi:MAG: YgeY family selenium metabolism-linked hydrolase [Bacteroidales bacterium]